MEFRQIETEKDCNQYIALMDYCFKDETGWTGRMFPLPPEDRAFGIFDGDKLAAAMLSKGFTSRIFGKTVLSNGIGCVATAPQYRNRKFIREIFSSVLREEYEKGSLFSALYPFLFDYYQKFGYGSLGNVVAYIFDPSEIRKPEPRPGRIVPFDNSTRHLDDMFSAYNQWVQNFDFGIIRPKPILEKFVQMTEADKAHIFLYYNEEETCQGFIQFYFKTLRKYVIRLKVESMAWVDSSALGALMHFLWTHRDQCSDIKWTPPPILPLVWLTKEPRIEQFCNYSWMARPLHVEKLLQLKAELNPTKAEIKFSLLDEILPENDATYIVRGSSVSKEPFEAINVLPFHLFSSLLFGGLSLKQARFAGLVSMSRGEEAEKFFSLNRNIFLSEDF